MKIYYNGRAVKNNTNSVSYTHLRAHETKANLVCRLLLEKNKFINDQFYSESKAQSMIRRGNSINKIRNYLMGKGIHDQFIKDTVEKIKEENSDQDFFSAIKICKKKRIGPARAEDNRTLFYKKDISLLARNGFDFETSRKVMDIEKDEYLKIINLL